jgi:hypothetical protein
VKKLVARTGFDDPGIESLRRRDFPRTTRPAQGASWLLYHGYRVSFPGGFSSLGVGLTAHPIKQSGRGVDRPPPLSSLGVGLTAHPHQAPSLKSADLPSLRLWDSMACSRVTFTFTFSVSMSNVSVSSRCQAFPSTSLRSSHSVHC